MKLFTLQLLNHATLQVCHAAELENSCNNKQSCIYCMHAALQENTTRMFCYNQLNSLQVHVIATLQAERQN